MATLSVSLPDSMQAFVDEQVARRGYHSCSDYICELIDRERNRTQLRKILLAGAEPGPADAGDDAYFDGLRDRIRSRSNEKP
ncbi:type II toxin-antitoxin system ParD family antitoxin [Nocardia sp. NPDC058640]|uniref:ribbon-helix-helix domain-containing protein n=1 Tax=Nocardia sp. NPDC058640 TaxID=3346571 RepID=UPI00365E7056